MVFLRGYRFCLWTISPFFSFIILLSSTPVKAETSPDLVYLLKKANEEKVYGERYWEILLHYKPSIFGQKSLIDDPRFFLSPNGKTNPQAELEATITAFFQSDKLDKEHPRCRFIARYAWLKERLNIDESLLPNITCLEWANLRSILQPRSVALIFPAFFMNNPASMFGHTLIRIDGSYQSKLLSYATNYAAATDAMGFLYPFKGIFGFYKGYFSIFPYYDMIKKYNDTEQRDMWEYHRDLSEEEAMKMFMHLWELKDIYSYYYFFDENCSYNLLFLLEAARPSLYLTDKFFLWAIPVDTMRIVRDSGIVENLEYRPSKATKIRYIASLLDEYSQEVVIKIVDQRFDITQLDALETQKRTRILDLAIEAIQYNYSKGVLLKDDYLKLFLSTLKERSQIGIGEADPYRIPIPVPPHEGHPSSRVSLRVGIKENRIFQEVGYRPAYHSLSDPDGGYSEGSQINFGNTSIRYYADETLNLERFDLIDVVSLSPRDRFFKPLSFKIKTGLTQKTTEENGEHLVWQVNPGIGLAFKSSVVGLYYGLVEADFEVGGGLKDNYIAGFGIQVGAVRTVTDFWKINVVGEALSYVFGERFTEEKVSVDQTLMLNRNNSLILSLVWNEVSNDGWFETELGWNYYF